MDDNLRRLSKWDPIHRIKTTPSAIIIISALFMALATVGVGMLTFIRSPIETPVMKGFQTAERLGCLACHKIDGQDGVPNPDSMYGDVLPFKMRGTVMAMIQSPDEIEEWIRYGAPKRLWVEGKRPESQSVGDGVLKMPAYDHIVTEEDVSNLVAYIQMEAHHNPPKDEIALKGYKLSLDLGCFGCHGEGGSGGISNPGSFKGYIPPWDGKDYNELVKDEAELKEWILEGKIARFENNPLAAFFTNGQVIKMPGYKDKLKQGDLEAIIAYINWVRNPDREIKNLWVDDNALLLDSVVNRGKSVYVDAGCAACHGAEGKGGVANPNTAEEEVPSLDDIAEKMQLFDKKDAEMFIRFLNESRDLELLYDQPPFENYQSVYETYIATRKLVIKGAYSLKKDKEGREPPMHMPSWEQRRNFDGAPFNIRDIDSVLAYLISLQNWEEEDEDEEEGEDVNIEIASDKSYLKKLRNYRDSFERASNIEFSGMHWNAGISLWLEKGQTLETYISNFEVYQEEFDSLGSGDEEEAAEFAEMYKEYPRGAAIVKEHFTSNRVGADPTKSLPKFLTIMVKREKDYDPLIGDWQFIKLNADGEVVIEGNSSNLAVRALCVECHRNVESRDFVFSSFYEEGHAN